MRSSIFLTSKPKTLVKRVKASGIWAVNLLPSSANFFSLKRIWIKIVMLLNKREIMSLIFQFSCICLPEKFAWWEDTAVRYLNAKFSLPIDFFNSKLCFIAKIREIGIYWWRWLSIVVNFLFLFFICYDATVSKQREEAFKGLLFI